MSDQPAGPNWWQASDGRWYPPEQSPQAGWWQASDGRWYPPEQHPSHQLQQAQMHYYRQQAQHVPRADRTHRIVQGAAVGWAIGVLLALVISAALAWWVVSGVDFSN
jgi:hypothetical protein